MSEKADQIFVLLQHWLVSLLPAGWQQPGGVVLAVLVIICLFPALFALAVWMERKGLGRIQNRLGPNRVGPFGLLQPIADGIKSLTKEDIVPRSADAAVHFLAPVVLVVTVFMGFAVLPMGRNMVLADMDAGLLFYFAMGASTELAVFMAGWSSRNKYSLLGAMRAVAQMISYEVVLLLSSVAVVMMSGSLSLTRIVEAQNHYSWGLPHWYIFTPWGCAGFVMYAIAATAETNRSPFDLPEGESELVAGYHTEYSGFKFALFFLGEYLAMFSISGLGTTLFLG
ncbi:MAG: complex I subunit 1 family protein, partial [Terracidiphilus sp.]